MGRSSRSSYEEDRGRLPLPAVRDGICSGIDEAWEDLLRRGGYLEIILKVGSDYASFGWEKTEIITDTYLHLRGTDNSCGRLRGVDVSDEVKFGHWLSRVARCAKINRIKEHLRREGHRRSEGGDNEGYAILVGNLDEILDAIAASDDTEQIALLGVIRAELLIAISRLRDSRCRHLLLMKYFQEMTDAEVGSVLGLTRVNVATIHHRNLKHLRTEVLPSMGYET